MLTLESRCIPVLGWSVLCIRIPNVRNCPLFKAILHEQFKKCNNFSYHSTKFLLKGNNKTCTIRRAALKFATQISPLLNLDNLLLVVALFRFWFFSIRSLTHKFSSARLRVETALTLTKSPWVTPTGTVSNFWSNRILSRTVSSWNFKIGPKTCSTALPHL